MTSHELQPTSNDLNANLPNSEITQKIITSLQFKCETKGCKLKFSSKEALSGHKSDHITSRPFACELCTATFTQSSNLKRHQKMHQGQKPFDCKICGKTFTTSSNLKQHQATHSNRGERKKSKCLVCEREYMYKCSLIKHIKEDHQLEDAAKYAGTVQAEDPAEEDQHLKAESEPQKRLFKEEPLNQLQLQRQVNPLFCMQLPQVLPKPQVQIPPKINVAHPSNVPERAFFQESHQDRGCAFIRVSDYLSFIDARQRVFMAQNLLRMQQNSKLLSQNPVSKELGQPPRPFVTDTSNTEQVVKIESQTHVFGLDPLLKQRMENLSSQNKVSSIVKQEEL